MQGVKPRPKFIPGDRIIAMIPLKATMIPPLEAQNIVLGAHKGIICAAFYECGKVWYEAFVYYGDNPTLDDPKTKYHFAVVPEERISLLHRPKRLISSARWRYR